MAGHKKALAPAATGNEGESQNQQHPKLYTALRVSAKRLIVAAGGRGMIPPRLAYLLIQKGGLAND